METGALAGRLGLGPPEAQDDAFAWRCLLAILLLFVLLYAVFYPNAVTNDDESQYLRQAALVVEGKSTVVQIDPYSGREVEFYPSTYAPGLAVAMAPFVHAFGWRGGYLVPLLGLVGAVLLTALLLRHEGRSPIFALVVFGFAPALVMSRVAMSDVPSAAVVALGLWCFFRGLDGSTLWWLASGFIAGASLTLRASNPLVFAPLFAGTVVRRELRCWALVVGGLAGLAVRAAAMAWYFGDPFFERDHYFFAPGTIHERLPYYLFGLLVLLPGGIVLALLYRGRRAPEVIAGVAIFPLFYLCQRYSMEATGLPKRLVLTLRYLIPLLPLMALACAESVPRLWRAWTASRDASARAALQRRASFALLATLVAVAAAGALVHPAFRWWSSTQAEIAAAIREHVPLDAVLVADFPSTRKFVRQLDRKYVLARAVRNGYPIQPAALRYLAERHPQVFLVLLSKSDSAYWRRRAARFSALVETLEASGALEPILDRQMSPTDRLRIWQVAPPSEPSAPSPPDP